MKAFLLAAGLGTRLRPLTDKTPKCLLPLGGKPLLQIWLELLGRHGVEEVVINTHWHHEKVEQYISTDYADYTDEINIEKRKKPYIYLFNEKVLLGSGGTLLANRALVADGEHFFILYGDNLTNVNLNKMYEFHLGHGLPFTLGVFRADEPERCGIAEIDEDGLVVDFVEKPDKPKSDLAAAGIYVADQRIFDFFPENSELIRPLDLGFHIIPNLVGKMRAYYIEEFLMDIGTVDSYEKAQAIYPQITQIDAD
jgi:mannose-1-phosphate guanylyltransferase